VGQSSTGGVFAPPGFLLFVRDQTLLAQAFDPERLALSGTPAALVPHVGFSQSLNRGSFSASATGVLAYGNDENNRPVWFDRGGKAHDAVAEDAGNSNLYLSRGGDQLAVERPDPGTGANDVFVIELNRGGIATKITTSPSSDTRAVWSADDRQLIWASNRTSVYDLYSKTISETEETALLVSPDSKIPTDVSPDGRFLLYESTEAGGKTSVRALWLTGEKTSFPLLESGFNEAQARMSPDGHWISYTIDKDGANEVYIVDAASVLPAPGTRTPPRRAGGLSSRRVSSNGGVQSMWRRDRKASELYYLAADRRLMAVTMTASGPGLPVPLFATRIVDLGRAYQHYAPSPDGQRFLILTPVAPRSTATIVLNWTRTLAQSK
jgi:dipeptidyl aminopeptidase/acylaminoacyl peptidase